MRDVLSSAITSFDNAIAGDVLELFPGGIESLPSRTDEEIQAVVNDFDGPSTGANYQKARLCLYGTTALVALVDPAHENLWVANLGDCEAGMPAPVQFRGVSAPESLG
jgi:pyruvate dehydrogenase phosphatase